MEYNRSKKEILMKEKILNDLDKFVLDFIRILKKHSDYVIISDYVSILLGRTRATEDIDLFIRPLDFNHFSELYQDLLKNNFWCINAEDSGEIFDYLKNMSAVRFARKGQIAPNFEVKFTKRSVDKEAFEDSIRVILSSGELIISSLERHIAFKRYYLKSEKDIEDALHVEQIFKENLDYSKINKMKDILENLR
jgi:hypothetical protein